MTISSVLPDGSVPIGFGDFVTDTGPINVLTVAPNGTVTTRFTAMDTEEIGFVRVLNGYAYVPPVDPRTNGQTAQLVTNKSGTWAALNVRVPGLTPLHIFDATFDGTTLMVCGSRYFNEARSAAMVWESTNGGSTWTEALSGPNGWFSAFYLMNGRPTVNLSGQTWSRIDESWVSQASFIEDQRADPFAVVAGTVVYTSERGAIGTVPTGIWTAALADDGAIWLCDRTNIYRLPPP